MLKQTSISSDPFVSFDDNAKQDQLFLQLIVDLIALIPPALQPNPSN